MFSINTLTMIKVEADHLKSPVTIDIRMEKGVPYFKASKSGWLARLLCKDGSSIEKALTGSRLLYSISTLRDNMHRTKVGIKKYQTKSKKAKVKQVMVDGTAAEIHTPTIAGIAGRTISILLDPPKSAVWVHADPSVMEYMYKVVNEERKHCKPNSPVMAKDKVESTIECPTGIIEIKSGRKKGYVRVRKHVGDEMTPEKPTKLKYRYLKIDYTNPDDTINRAVTWRDNDSISDDEESNGDVAENDDDDDDDDVAGCDTGAGAS